MNKNELKTFILTRFGYPLIRVELHDSQLDNCINTARQKFIKWAVGNATQETFFTMTLSGGVDEYELLPGVTEVIGMNSISSDDGGGGINTLFSFQNYLYNSGAMGFLNNYGSGGILDYHTTMEYLDLLDTYTADKYNWIYHKFANKIKIIPTPETGNTFTITDSNGNSKDIDSPGYMLIRSYMIDGSNITSSTTYNDWLWDYDWIQDYATALAKQILGLTRRKFAQFTSIGNNGISLDGDTLVSEAKEEIQALEETLRLEEVYDGTGYILVS